MSTSRDIINEMKIIPAGLKQYYIFPDPKDMRVCARCKAYNLKELRESFKEDDEIWTDDEWDDLIIFQGEIVQNNPFS